MLPHLAVSLGEDLPEPLPVLDELLPLPLNLADHLAATHHVAQDLVREEPLHVALVGQVELVLLEREVGQSDGLDRLELDQLGSPRHIW